MGICSGPILTFVKIMTCVQTLEAPLLFQWAHLTYKPDISSRGKPQVSPRAHNRWHHLTGVVQLSGTPPINTSSFPINTEILPGATQSSNTKTLWSSLLLHYLQLDNTIPVIHGSDYAARSSLRFKHCNTPISMQAVMNSDRYLYMMILQSSDVI